MRHQLMLAGLVCTMLLAYAAPAQGFTERVSLGDGEQQAEAASRTPSMSADGRYVAFVSEADHLVVGEGTWWDIFVRDRLTGTTVLVSQTNSEGPSNGDSFLPSISADGRYVAFVSRASNLASGDTDFHINDVYVRDLRTGTTELVSTALGRDEPDSASTFPAISGDGRHVAFQSSSSNLVAGDSNGRADIFVRDLEGDTTDRVNLSSAGDQATRESFRPAIDAQGRFVAFLSHSPNLVAGDTTEPPGSSSPPDQGDVFVRDRETDRTERVSVSSEGDEATHLSLSPAISGDGRFVSFKSLASNLVDGDTNQVDDVFLHDRDTDATERVNLSGSEQQADAGGFSGATSVSDDGRFVAFGSSARNLVARRTNGSVQAFRRDRRDGTTRLVSVGSTWQEAEDGVYWLDMASAGDFVAFDSFADNLVRRDTNFTSDVFVHTVNPRSVPTCDESQATIAGTRNDDQIVGTPGPDVIVGLGGNDSINGGGGNDTICGDGGGDDRTPDDDGSDDLAGGDGDDVLIGQGREDRLKGSAGDDVLLGGVGDDGLSGSLGSDVLVGNPGVDALTAGSGDDRLKGDSGVDVLDGQGGQDALWGGSGADRLAGGSSDDYLEGEFGDDRLTGAQGADRMSGGSGADMLAGGDGNDSLAGGVADDRLYGNDGDDGLDGGTHLLGDRCRQGLGTGALEHCEL